MAVTFFGSASTPTDGGSNSASPTVITPPASMLDGDLVIVSSFSRLLSDTLAVSADGGQTWNTMSVQSGTGQRTTRWFWCRFNGTWSANPSFSHGGTNNTCIMAVFRPSTGANTWAVDVTEVHADFAAPLTPFDVTITGITTLTDGAVVVAGFASIDQNTWVLQTAGWNNVLSINNLAGNDTGSQLVYEIQATAGASGNVTSRQTALAGDNGQTYIAAFKEVAAAGAPNLGRVEMADYVAEASIWS
jgi:hypothetical protein